MLIDTDSHHRRRRSRVTPTSDSEDGQEDLSRTRLNRIKKAMFGDKKFDREPIVTEDIEQYRPLLGEEKHLPKITEFNGKSDPEDHRDKYELLMIGMGHNNTLLWKMFKTYLKGPASM